MLFRGDHWFDASPDLGWGELVGGRVEVIDIDGGHQDVLSEQNAARIAARLLETWDEPGTAGSDQSGTEPDVT